MAITNPNVYFPGYAVLAAGAAAPAAGILIPTAALENFDPASNDVRVLAYEFTKILRDAIAGLPAEDKPTRFTISRSSPIGINDSTVRQSYTLNFDLDIQESKLASEANQAAEA